jgi:hypothetical protein
MAKIGCFWVYKNKVIGRARTIGEGADCDGRIDSPDTHRNLWEEDRTFKKPSELADTEYQTVPRGRVVWFKKEKTAVVYMDRKLLDSSAVRKKVATFFGLAADEAEWKADLHYTTDPDEIDSLFKN